MNEHEQRNPERAATARPKRMSKRALRIAAAGSAAVAFVVPWAALKAVPRPPAASPRIVYVQGHGTHTTTGTPSVTTTRASGAPVIH